MTTKEAVEALIRHEKAYGTIAEKFVENVLRDLQASTWDGLADRILATACPRHGSPPGMGCDQEGLDWFCEARVRAARPQGEET